MVIKTHNVLSSLCDYREIATAQIHGTSQPLPCSGSAGAYSKKHGHIQRLVHYESSHTITEAVRWLITFIGEILLSTQNLCVDL